MVIVWWSMPIWSTTAFWICWNHYIRDTCSANWWDAPNSAMLAAGIGQQKGPNSLQQCLTARCTTKASKTEQTGLQSFASSAIFIWPLTYLSLLQASWQIFAVKTIPQLARGRKKCFPRVCRIPKHRLLCYRNKQTYFSLAKKNVVIVMVSILINKDVFEPSYNDLKFMVKNHNYICTHLIYELNCKNLVF